MQIVMAEREKDVGSGSGQITTKQNRISEIMWWIYYVPMRLTHSLYVDQIPYVLLHC